MARRLRRTSPDQPGWSRRRAGRGFVYTDAQGSRVTDPDELARLRQLAIPPAWREVWITPYPNGHLQAVGTDDAGRRQYLYHEQWRLERDQEKHHRVIKFARRLPAARELVGEHLALPGMPRERALATAFRLLDLGFFRVGGEVYTEENGSFGLATLRKEHVTVGREGMSFDYVAKSGNQRQVTINDGSVREVVAHLRRRRGGGPELLAWRDGRRWRDLSSDDINAYVKQVVRTESSAKDFRTWHATVLAAVTLAAMDEPRSMTAGRRAVSAAMKEVAEYLGNTPAVSRASYVDPRIVDLFSEGVTIKPALHRIGYAGALTDPVQHGRVERAVLRLLASGR